MNQPEQDPIAEKLRAIEWQYAPRDLRSLNELRERLERTGRATSMICYSDLVRGVEFSYPNIQDGKPFFIDSYEWSGLERRILGDCLGYLSTESYLRHGFMVSALAVAKLESKPSKIFFEWMEALGILPDLTEDRVLKFWTDQMKLAHRWYQSSGAR